MAGYSKRSLADKLGIRNGQKIYIRNAPAGYSRLLGATASLKISTNVAAGFYDFMQFFAKERVLLEREFPKLKKALAWQGMLWISWPKRASKVKSDLSDDVVREIGLANGLVDIKGCAVDDTWSGLKFVYRLKDRPN